MARNRKRTKARRQRQPVAARSSDLPVGAREPESNGAPDPLAHASPDAELAEAQLAMGRGVSEDIESVEDERELEELAAGGVPPDASEAVSEDAVAGVPENDAASVPEAAAGTVSDNALAPSRRQARRARRGGELATSPSTAPAHRPGMGSRLVAFLRGSWAELQRVQWPDRRQVMQATGVVIGFVIVAGAFLGVADFVAGKVMTFILK